LKFIDPRLYRLEKGARDAVKDYKESISAGNLKPRTEVKNYPWFMPLILAWSKEENYFSYHAGSYLQHMMSIFLLMQLLLMAPMGWLAITKTSPVQWDQVFSLGCLTYIRSLIEVKPTYAIPFSIMMALIWLRHLRIRRRRLLLENEILSIHSCGVIWQAVAMAHVIARRACKGFCEHYTEILANEAKKAAGRKFELHQWFNEEMLEPEASGSRQIGQLSFSFWLRSSALIS
jgi:hypothetical protein